MQNPHARRLTVASVDEIDEIDEATRPAVEIRGLRVLRGQRLRCTWI